MLLAKGREKAKENENKVREGLKKPLKRFYASLPSLESLSSSTLKEDEAFLDEIGNLLPSFASIFFRPHIKVNYIDSLERAEVATNIDNASFIKTERDSSLWKKKKDGSFSPEYVHFEESIDDMATYENYFIIDVYNHTYALLEEYELDYLPALSMAQGDKLVKEKSEEEALFIKIASLRRKMERLKQGLLYKTLGDHKRSEGRIYPTNILVKEQNYGKIYRFYTTKLKMDLSLTDKEALTYSYLSLVMKALKKKGYYLITGSRKDLRFLFRKENFKIELNAYPSRGLIGFYVEEIDGGSSYTKWLFFNEGYHYTGRCDCPYMDEDMCVLSVFSLAFIDKDGRIKEEYASMNNAALMKRFIDSLTISYKASEALYTTFCPYCHSKMVASKNGEYSCSSCGSVYGFYTKRNDRYCWIKREGEKEHE